MDEYIFLCFSGDERQKYAESINYHLKNWGINVWYDYEKIFLGDLGDFVNIEDGVYKSNIFIIFISESLLKSKGAILELEHIKKMIDKKIILHIIPIFCDITVSSLPNELKWINDYIYGEIILNNTSGTYDLAIDIYCKLLKILCKKENIDLLANTTNDSYLKKLKSIYMNLDSCNISNKITILYTMIIYNKIINNHCNKYSYLINSADRIYTKSILNIAYNTKELICFELLTSLLLI